MRRYSEHQRTESQNNTQIRYYNLQLEQLLEMNKSDITAETKLC